VLYSLGMIDLFAIALHTATTTRSGGPPGGFVR
jgi:hypothetical protein